MTQKEEVFTYCEGKEGYFTLQEVYQDLFHLSRPTLRNLVQKARDAGIITFVDNYGLYKR